MNFLKRADIFIAVLCLTIALSACSAGTMGEHGNGEDETANLDLTSLKYLEQMYKADSGKKLYQRSLAGSLFLADDNFILRNITESLNIDFFENIDTLKSPSGKFWEDRGFNLSQLSKKLESRDSADAFDNYIEESFNNAVLKSENQRSSSADNQSRVISKSTDIGTALPAVIAFAGIYSAYEGYNQTDYIKDISSTLRKILKKLDDIDKKNAQIQGDLRKIERDINEINDEDYEMSILLNRNDLNDAENRVNGFLVEISTIEDIDDAERLSMIKDFLLHGYEEMYISAFQSALNVNSYINNKRDEDKKMPLSMSLSDLSFMMELSFLRLSFAPLIFKGEDMLNYRANIAKADLARVRLLKRSFARAYDKIANEEYRNMAMTLIATWDIILMAHIQVVQDIDDIVIAELDFADNYNLGFGTFGNEETKYGHLLTRNDGTFIVDAVAVKYGDFLLDVFDTGISGAFSNGKYIRILENGKNVMDPAGLGLIPVCMNFSRGVVAPPKDKVYIDPVTGQFSLPRPSYWSRIESSDNICSSEIHEGKPFSEFTGTCSSETFPEGKFGNGYCLYNYDYSNNEDIISSHSGSRDIYPFGKGNKRDMNKGTVSLWFNIEVDSLAKSSFAADNYAKSYIEISGENSNLFCIIISKDANLLLPLTGNGLLTINDESLNVQFDFDEGMWIHLFVLWDGSNNLEGGKSVRIFINGTEILNSITELPELAEFAMRFKIKNETLARKTNVGMFQYLYKNGMSYSYIRVDNIQIWNDVVTEDPDLFYNNGNGREDVIHSIYGPENGYKPSNVGVGYHYVQ